MTTDYRKIIKDVFRNGEKAWVYAESFDAVRIGKWDGSSFKFYIPLEEEYLLLLRVFNERCELRFTGDKHRNTNNYPNHGFIPKLACTRYYMYGEHAQVDGEFTKLWEERGGELWFPAKLSFPNGRVALKLEIKNFVRYNRVPILPKDEDFDVGLGTSGAGMLEVVDYAYTGFYYEDGKAVAL